MWTRKRRETNVLSEENAGDIGGDIDIGGLRPPFDVAPEAVAGETAVAI